MEIDTLETDMHIKFDLKVKVNTRESAGIFISVDRRTDQTTEKVIPIKKITKLLGRKSSQSRQNFLYWCQGEEYCRIGYGLFGCGHPVYKTYVVQ